MMNCSVKQIVVATKRLKRLPRKNKKRKKKLKRKREKQQLNRLARLLKPRRKTLKKAALALVRTSAIAEILTIKTVERSASGKADANSELKSCLLVTKMSCWQMKLVVKRHLACLKVDHARSRDLFVNGSRRLPKSKLVK